MKTPLDPRHQLRIKAVQSLFQWNFHKKQPLDSLLAKTVIEKQNRIDKIIKKAATEWPINQINHIDLAILRLAIYEMLVLKKEPIKVVIDEAIELGKTFGGEKSPQFINGVLGTVFKKQTEK